MMIIYLQFDLYLASLELAAKVSILLVSFIDFKVIIDGTGVVWPLANDDKGELSTVWSKLKLLWLFRVHIGLWLRLS